MIDALHRSEERYRLVIEHVARAWSWSGRPVRVCQHAACEVMEMTMADMLARGYLERIHPDDLGMVQERRRRRLANEPVPNQYDIRLLMPDGRVKWIDIGVTLVPWERHLHPHLFLTSPTSAAPPRLFTCRKNVTAR